MPAPEPIARLAALARTFGPAAAEEKLRLLRELGGLPRPGARARGELVDALSFLRAYPDDARVRSAAAEAIPLVRAWSRGGGPADKALPGGHERHPYSWAVLRRLAQLQPGRTTLDPRLEEDEEPLVELLSLFLPPGEVQGLEDERLSLLAWLERCRGARTDLEFVLDRLAESGLPERVQAHLFESCKLWVRFAPGEGAGRGELARDVARPHFQKEPFSREPFPLEPEIRRPPGRARLLAPREGRALLDVALLALAVRRLEIYPLTWGNPADVTLVACGRGLEIALVGTRPGFRSPLETLTFFLLLQNGVPVAYGPAGALLGVCEMGINLFPEFRGGPTRFLYAQLMRVLHHLLGVEHFYLTPYGMGEGNAEARASGAFWFYRRLGFRPASARVEALAREEEARMAADPRHRSPPAMLARLSHTSAHLDLSGGRRPILELGGAGLRQSEIVAHRFGGDRPAAEERCAVEVAPLLGLPASHEALRALAPLLASIADLPRWSAAERRRLGAAVRAKGARSELPAARKLRDHARLVEALHGIARAKPRGVAPPAKPRR